MLSRSLSLALRPTRISAPELERKVRYGLRGACVLGPLGLRGLGAGRSGGVSPTPSSSASVASAANEVSPVLLTLDRPSTSARSLCDARSGFARQM